MKRQIGTGLLISVRKNIRISSLLCLPEKKRPVFVVVVAKLEHTERTQLQVADVAQEYVSQAAKMTGLGKLN